ncbi:hypothetical protein EGW08_014429 [Elysia chlorotica]|uniref:Uncharacterized protein n=1 Tax=Elysia chlorotica TaxID=188477 RepID=A0A433T8A7_ELYCH|nr:hypothetical protein EGW08_014429 [Elysia chlorotica]
MVHTDRLYVHRLLYRFRTRFFSAVDRTTAVFNSCSLVSMKNIFGDFLPLQFFSTLADFQGWDIKCIPLDLLKTLNFILFVFFFYQGMQVCKFFFVFLFS